VSTSIYEIPIQTISGANTSLAEYKGKVLLVVNVASKCGLTPQYEALEKIYSKYKDQGLVVTGFPCNDFAGQEPGANDEIASFCTGTFGVDFPLFSKITIVGPEKHPLYDALITAQPTAVSMSGKDFRQGLRDFGVEPNADPEVLWNFEKFLISRSGEVVRRFSPDTLPDDPEIVAAIEKELAKS
jgi:glutathione peroxidase